MRTAKNRAHKIRLIIAGFLAFIFYSAISASVTIQCDNKNYAGRKFEFYSYTDPVSSESQLVFSLEIDQNGKSVTTIEIPKTQYVFCDFGIYRGLLYLEPNQKIIIKLPPVREKSFADQKNPYFEPVSFWFATEDKQQVNNQISDFTNRLNQLTDKYFDQLYFRQSKQIYDSLVYFIDKDFGGIKSESFELHKLLSLKMVEVDAFRLKPEDYSTIFSSVKTQFWLFPSFTDLFDKTFAGQLSFAAKSVKGDEIRKAVNQANVSFLIQNTKTKYNLSEEMADLAVLKMLHDGFYSGDFSKTSIQKMVKSEIFTGNKNSIIRESALRISEKITYLQPGSAAPSICLNNLDGKKVCTDQNNGKYKYLIFADTEMVVCREHLKYLAAIQEKFASNLDIFIVLRNTEPVQMKKFFAENQIPGIKMVDDKGEFISEFKVRSFPQCYLLDQYHKVKITSVKAPLDGFEQQFGSILRNDLIEQQRKQGK